MRSAERIPVSDLVGEAAESVLTTAARSVWIATLVRLRGWLLRLRHGHLLLPTATNPVRHHRRHAARHTIRQHRILTCQMHHALLPFLFRFFLSGLEFLPALALTFFDFMYFSSGKCDGQLQQSKENCQENLGELVCTFVRSSPSTQRKHP